MNFKRGDVIELEITDLAFGGEGVGKIKSSSSKGSGDFVVFVAGAAPGDTVLARLFKIKKQYAQAKLEKLLNPSKERIQPRCRHFGNCGGCSLQFLDYSSQIKWKEKIVGDAIRQISGFKDIKIEPIIGCDDPWFYRNKMEYSFGTGQKSVLLGLHPPKSYKEIFDLHECFLQSPVSAEIAKAVKAWAQEKKLEAFNPQTGKGILKNLVVREGKNTNELLVNLVLCKSDFPEDFAKMILHEFPNVTSVYATTVVIKKGFKTIIKEFHIAGKKTLTETLSVKHPEKDEKITLKFEILPQAFFQPNTKQAEILYGKILEFANPKEKDSVLDLFCGTGTIGMFFAKCCGQVFGVEINQSAIESAKSNAQTNKINNIEFLCADAEKVFKSENQFIKKRPSILITDPPRAGIAQKTLLKILEMKISKWVYVSCNPATLARDLKIACGAGYKIQKIQPVDMFPHTYHVETVCLLSLPT